MLLPFCPRSFNPPALLSGEWHSHIWMYFLGEFAGAVRVRPLAQLNAPQTQDYLPSLQYMAVYPSLSLFDVYCAGVRCDLGARVCAAQPAPHLDREPVRCQPAALLFPAALIGGYLHAKPDLYVPQATPTLTHSPLLPVREPGAAGRQGYNAVNANPDDDDS